VCRCRRSLCVAAAAGHKMQALLSKLCGCAGQGALEEPDPPMERRESFTARALHMVARDGEYLSPGAERLPEDFNVDESTRSFEVLLTGADPDVTRAATLEVVSSSRESSRAKRQRSRFCPHIRRSTRCVLALRLAAQGEDGVAVRKSGGGALLGTFHLGEITAWKATDITVMLHVSTDDMQTFQSITIATEQGAEICAALQVRRGLTRARNVRRPPDLARCGPPPGGRVGVGKLLSPGLQVASAGSATGQTAWSTPTPVTLSPLCACRTPRTGARGGCSGEDNVEDAREAGAISMRVIRMVGEVVPRRHAQRLCDVWLWAWGVFVERERDALCLRALRARGTRARRSQSNE